MKVQSITCKNCGLIDDYNIVQKGNHKTAICNGCGRYIKHLPQEGGAKFYFGKYKDQLVSEVNDIEYLQWVWDNVKLSEKMRDAIDLKLQQLHKSV
jgi:hypothetical protein